jgi:hypothetical protein
MKKNVFSLFAIPTYLKLIFVALFCLVTLCNCGSPKPPDDVRIFEPNPTPEPVPIRDFNDTELGKQIRRDYLSYQLKQGYEGSHTINDILIDAYYGTYNDCVLVWIDDGTGPMAGHETIVSGILFRYRNMWEIIAWKAGQFYELQEASDLGLFTRENLLDVAISHNHKQDYLDGNHVGLSVETENYLNDLYLMRYRLNLELPDITKDNISTVAYYGTYNGCIAVIVDVDGVDYTEGERLVVIAGVPFYYKNENSIMVWVRGGPSYALGELQEAYDRGLLKQEDLKKIADQHNRVIE